ncbi:MAG: quinolinate synthase NadA [Candidatus Zixiibacteriota bacterium]
MSSESNLVKQVKGLKEDRKAVILAHNYQLPKVQDIADFVGDSLGLARRAAELQPDVILFCGVHFMAETAAVLCPNSIVLMPDSNAGCPMANMINVRQLRNLKAKHPRAVVVCYVNSSAAVKAVSDYCCTSSNASSVMEAIPQDREVIFVPDKYLGSWAARQTSRNVILWEGYCPTHVRILPEHILAQRKKHPRALVLAHPECLTEVSEMADVVASTSGMVRFCRESPAEEFIIATEIGILHQLKTNSPKKQFYPATELADCPNMKLNNLEKMLWALEDMSPQVTVPGEIAEPAKLAIDQMVSIGWKREPAMKNSS